MFIIFVYMLACKQWNIDRPNGRQRPASGSELSRSWLQVTAIRVRPFCLRLLRQQRTQTSRVPLARRKHNDNIEPEQKGSSKCHPPQLPQRATQKPKSEPHARQSTSCTKSPLCSYAKPCPQVHTKDRMMLTTYQNTDLDRQSLSYCVSLIENGVNPEALAVRLLSCPLWLPRLQITNRHLQKVIRELRARQESQEARLGA